MTESELLSSSDPAAMLRYLQHPKDSDTVWNIHSLKPPSDRKLRLFATACCRQVWHLLTDQRSRRAVEVAEQYVEGLASDKELQQACDESVPVGEIGSLAMAVPYLGNLNMVQFIADCGTDYSQYRWPKGCRASQAALLREIVGNPYRPVKLPLKCRCGQWDDAGDGSVPPRCKTCYGVMQCPWLTWNDGAVVKIASTIYEERDFAAMPMLRGALMDAGCDNEAILHHCQDEEPCDCEYTGYEMPRPRPIIDTGPPVCRRCRDGWRPLRSPHVRGCHVLDLLLGRE